MKGDGVRFITFQTSLHNAFSGCQLPNMSIESKV